MSADTTHPVIDVNDLVKSFDGKPVVKGISIQVNKGEIVGFLGPNGSGKTTSLRLMCGLLTPDSGTGQCLGYDILKDSHKIRQQIGYMTQKFSFYEDLTVMENLDFVGELYDLKDRARHVNEMMQQFSLTPRRKQIVGTLSGGWKQRLALAASVIHTPQLLLLDEPTAGVDPNARREFWDRIHELAADGLTVLVSTHYIDEAERCHRVIYVSDGKVVTRGTADEIVAEAALSTWIVRGKALDALARTLEERPEVRQVARFGQSLHVLSADGAKLDALAQEMSANPAHDWQRADTSLEDVLIDFGARSGSGNAP